MDQHTLRQAPGAKRPRKRVGRGNAAGGGTYAGRGLKGQKARSGGKVRIGFEGGQMPIMRRLGHRRGFRNPTRIEFQAVNLAALEQNFEAGARVDAEALAALRLIEDASQPFKVLARGELTRPLTVVAPRLSGAAKQAISDAGGSFEELAPAEHREVRCGAAQTCSMQMTLSSFTMCRPALRCSAAVSMRAPTGAARPGWPSTAKCRAAHTHSTSM